MDSSGLGGLDWTPVDSSGLLGVFGWESPLESTGVQWSPFGIRGGTVKTSLKVSLRLELPACYSLIPILLLVIAIVG